MEQASKNIICYEKWDYEVFEQIRRFVIEPKELARSLKKIKLECNAEGRVLVHYSTKKGDSEGRLYANLARQDELWSHMYWPLGISLQGMAKWVRHFVAHKYYRDFDISNCAPNLMEQILKRYNLCPPSLTDYNQNRSALFDRYSRRYNISRQEVKTVFIGLLHTGKADQRFIESVILKQELGRSLRELLKLKEYAPLYESVSKRDNPLGAFAFLVWSREEHTVLMKMREYFVALGYHRDHMVLCFDGIMIEKDESLDPLYLDLNRLSVYIKETTGFSLKIEEKSLLPTPEDILLYHSLLGDINKRD